MGTLWFQPAMDQDLKIKNIIIITNHYNNTNNKYQNKP